MTGKVIQRDGRLSSVTRSGNVVLYLRIASVDQGGADGAPDRVVMRILPRCVSIGPMSDDIPQR